MGTASDLRFRWAQGVGGLDVVPHHAGILVGAEQQVRWVLLVDVADQAPIDPEPDQLLQSGTEWRTVSTGSPSCWFSC